MSDDDESVSDEKDKKCTGRKIKTFPYRKTSSKSYGIILEADSSSGTRFMIVMRNASYEYITILGGNYRISELPDLVKGMDPSEINKIVKMYAGDYINECIRVRVTPTPLFDINYKYLLKSLEGVEGSYLQWSWPKGIMSRNDTTTFDTAIRHFKNKTGITVKRDSMEGRVSRDNCNTTIKKEISNVYYHAKIPKTLPKNMEACCLTMWASIEQLDIMLPEEMYKPT